MSETTTDEIYDSYRRWQVWAIGTGDTAREKFDAWLAEVERAAAERAWGEGHIAGRDYQGDGWNQDAHDPSEDNPYRAAALGLTAEQEEVN